MDNFKKSKIGEKFVLKYLKKQGYDAKKAEVNGYDIIASKSGDEITIEVKTSKINRKNRGIPDLHDTEFNREGNKWFFVPDFLYVVRINEDTGKALELDILTREEVDRYADNHKTVTKIRTQKLDTDLKNKKVGKTIILN